MDIVESIQKLHEIRNIPQFLFLSPIQPKSMMTVRTEIMNFVKENPDTKEIDFIINSGGGSPADAYRIIRTLRNNFDNVNVIVPFWAKSAATLLSLGANSIIMDEFGEFGPLDIQIGVEKDDSPEVKMESTLNDEYSVRRIEARAQELYHQMFVNLHSSNEVKINKNELSNQLLQYLSSFYKPLLKQINPYNLGRKKRLLDIGEQYAVRILTSYNPSPDLKKKEFLIDYLVNRCPDHGYVIDYNLISLFLDNVVLSKDIGTEYEKYLSVLTSNLIVSHDVTYVGFILKEDTQTTENTDTSIETTSDIEAAEATIEKNLKEQKIDKNQIKAKQNGSTKIDKNSKPKNK